MLVLQPDFGQTLLVTGDLVALFFMAGISLLWIGASAVAGVARARLGLFRSCRTCASRVDRFLNPALGDSYQADRALHSFLEGGFFGRGPGEGTIKAVLPDAHTDFIFAVVAEEYGVIACLVLLALFAFDRGARVLQASRSGGFVRHARDGRADHAVRAAGADQHGRQCRAGPGQGHDAALHLQRRLVDACRGADHGLRWADAAKADGRTRARAPERVRHESEAGATPAKRSGRGRRSPHRCCLRPAGRAATVPRGYAGAGAAGGG